MSTAVGSTFDRDALLALDDVALLAHSRVDAFRGSGPGGQKRNKTSSGIRVTHLASRLAATATVDRSQQSNLKEALRSLRLAIAFAIRREVAADASLPAETPRMIAYPLAVARAFDALEARAWSLRDAAEALGTTTGQLGGWLTHDALVLGEANRHRRERGLRPLQARH